MKYPAITHIVSRFILIPLFAIVPASAQSLARRDVASDLASERREDVVELSPFVVQPDNGWVASSSLVGNRTNKDISDLPLSIDAITSEFMQDLGAYTLDDAARFVPGAIVTDRIDGWLNDNTSAVSYRGMQGNGDNSARNFFMWYGPTDNYNIERIDFNKGSNSLMFGDASPAGQAATYTKRAQFRSFTKLTGLYGSFESHRAMLDVNRRLNDEVAVRLNYVDRADGVYIENTGYTLRAMHGAVTVQPFKQTQIRIEGERGFFDRTRGNNQILVRENSAPGLGLNRTNTWYYTSDGAIFNRTRNFTSIHPNPSARDAAQPSGLTLSNLEGMTVVVPLFTSGAATSGVAIPTDRAKALPGPSRSLSISGPYADRIYRPYGNVSVWLLQNVNKLTMEVAYNNQLSRQYRNDDGNFTIVMDANGRPFYDRGISNKDFSNRVEIVRGTLSYPFDLGKWGTQYVVATAYTQEDLRRQFIYSLGNVAVTEGGAADANLVNNKIVFRAYLDDPAFGSAAFWQRLTPAALPSVPGFRAEFFDDSINSPIQIFSSKAYSLSSAGTYLRGRLHSLLGVRYDSFKRKSLTGVSPRDSFGRAIFRGYPDEAPSEYWFDPESDLDNTCYSAGLAYNLARSTNLYGNYSTSFRWQGDRLFTGEIPGPVLGRSYEFGLKGRLLDNKLFFTLAAYRTDRENAIFVWSGGPTDENLVNLFNPNNLSPGDPGYFSLRPNLNNESHKTLASERAQGVDATLQFQRIGGVQARLTVSYTEVSGLRDFTAYKTFLEAAVERTNAALAPGGDPAMAEIQADITSAQNVVRANEGSAPILGNRSTPWAANWLFDYEFDRGTFLQGTRIGIHGNWRDRYNMSNLGGVIYRGSASHPVGLYAIHRRRILDWPASLRLGVRNVVDLEALGESRRRSAVIARTPDGNTINQYRYVNPRSWDFTMTLEF